VIASRKPDISWAPGAGCHAQNRQLVGLAGTGCKHQPIAMDTRTSATEHRHDPVAGILEQAAGSAAQGMLARRVGMGHRLSLCDRCSYLWVERRGRSMIEIDGRGSSHT
jgi:hypothetical protein